MRKEAVRFQNELGNWIEMEVILDDQEIRVRAEGPTNLTEHTWTLKEAKALRLLLTEVSKPMQHDRRWKI